MGSSVTHPSAGEGLEVPDGPPVGSGLTRGPLRRLRAGGRYDEDQGKEDLASRLAPHSQLTHSTEYVWVSSPNPCGKVNVPVARAPEIESVPISFITKASSVFRPEMGNV